MNMPLKTAFRNLECTDSLEPLIEQLTARIKDIFHQVKSCQVIVEATHTTFGTDQLYTVHIDIKSESHELAISSTSEINHLHSDVYATVRWAFHEVENRLRQHYAAPSISRPKISETKKTLIEH